MSKQSQNFLDQQIYLFVYSELGIEVSKLSLYCTLQRKYKTKEKKISCALASYTTPYLVYSKKQNEISF